MTNWLLLIVCLSVACQDVTSAIHQKKSSKNLEHSMNVIHEWKYLDYDFDSNEKKQAAIQFGEYDYTKNYPFDVDQWHGKIFVFYLTLYFAYQINLIFNLIFIFVIQIF